jgi:hypothetical protein
MFRLFLGLLLITASSPARAGDSIADTSAARPVIDPEFAIDVMSVLSKAGCNAGTCHGNLNGKGGFKLSLRGQDAQFDYHALVLASRGRRINAPAPGQSLFLLKATGGIAHRGGIRFDTNSPEYQLLESWLRQGARGPSPDASEVVRLDVQPSQAIVVDPQDELQIHVRAHFSDGTSRDVTDRACYEMSNLKATATPGGLVVRNDYGETTLIVRYLQKQLAVPIAFTRDRPNFRWADPPQNNDIDRHTFAKLRRLRINPSPLCDDSVFLRRAYLDAIGRLPTAEEAREFASDDAAGKRSRQIDALLIRPEFADYWALKWADILRTEEKVLDTQGVEAFHGWIRDCIASARPLDQFARDLVTGVGSTYKHPPANFYRANRDPSTRGETTARLFLGTRLQCAKCHNHPFDRWTQDDYYRWSSLFSQIDYDLGENKRQDKLDNNEFVGEQTVLVAKKDEVRNPTSGQIAAPKFLGGPSLADVSVEDRLSALARWLTAPENELFAKSQTNFIWYHMMGRGLVDPIDDFRMTNPPSNPDLLDWLSAELVASGFDLRYLVRTIMNSRTYQLSSEPNATNVDDQTSYSRALVQRLPAEVILDMQSDVLDSPAGFVGYPMGIRAVQIPGVHKKRPRDQPPLAGDRFLKTFGKPERILACDCERSSETTLKQAFTLIGDGLNDRIASPGNRVQRLAASTMSDREVVEELYWTALSRPPTVAERSAAIEMINTPIDKVFKSYKEALLSLITAPAAERAPALQDLAWALLNAKEFLFRR